MIKQGGLGYAFVFLGVLISEMGLDSGKIVMAVPGAREQGERYGMQVSGITR